MKKHRIKAFTMAEVLIAIAIIGVIAALVLPVMMKNYNNRIFATKARRAYTAVVDACSHGLSDDQVKYPGDIIDSYCEYIPGKSCTTGESGSITLKDGTVLTLTGWGNNPGGDLEVSIDTNDTKGPNTSGIDKWKTTLTRDCKLADNGSKGTIGYLKNHDWKIAGDDSSALSMESKCSFIGGFGFSVCNQDDGTTKWCSDWAQTNCKTIPGECKQIGENSYFSCPDGDNQKIYNINDGRLRRTLPSNCTAISSGYMSCPDGDNQKLYYMWDGSLRSTFPSNCTSAGQDYMSCPDGDNLKIYDKYNGSLKSTIPGSNCTALDRSYMSCPDGDNQKIYMMYNGSLKSTFPSNYTFLGAGYMSCPDGDNTKIYAISDGSLRRTFPSNYKYATESHDMTYFDGTQTKFYSISNGREETSYAKAGDCAYDSTSLYVCTNGNKKTYYISDRASSGIEVDADCADPFCSNKQ